MLGGWESVVASYGLYVGCLKNSARVDRGWTVMITALLVLLCGSSLEDWESIRLREWGWIYWARGVGGMLQYSPVTEGNASIFPGKWCRIGEKLLLLVIRRPPILIPPSNFSNVFRNTISSQMLKSLMILLQPCADLFLTLNHSDIVSAALHLTICFLL